jgi:4-hydroxy-tetrahydrodipicolinate synthase
MLKTGPRRPSMPPPIAAKSYGGVVAVTVTPCRQPGEVDPPALTRLCRILSEQGCQGLFVVGSTGEMPLLDDDDRRRLIAAAREGAETDVVLYAGVTGTGLRQTIRYAHAAATEGADVAVLMVPLMFKFSQQEILAYVRAVADASPIPVALYHHLRMPTELAVETVARLAEHPNLVAIKDTSQNLDRLAQLVAVARPHRLAVMQGCETLIYESLRRGGAGCVVALAGIVPEWLATLWRSHIAGDQVMAEQAQQQLFKLCELFRLPALQQSFGYFGYMLKRALQFRGWLDHTAGMMPGLVLDPDLDRAIDDILCRAEVKRGGGTLS